MTDETIVINCPHCSRSHSYGLRIKRSAFLFGKSGTTRRFKRLFTCPNEGKDFESVLEIREDERGTITSLDILGPAEDTKADGTS